MHIGQALRSVSVQVLCLELRHYRGRLKRLKTDRIQIGWVHDAPATPEIPLPAGI